MIERAELHDAAQKAFPADALKPARDASWQLAAEMGWLLLPLPEDAGGLGLGRDASAAIHFELGRVLSGAPLIPALLTVQALAASEGLADKASWLERACGGELITINLLPGSVTAAGGKLNGTLPGVADADLANHVLVLAPGSAVLVPLSAAGVTVTERPLWDESRRLFDVALADVAFDPALVLATGEASHAIARHLQGELALALAADSLGGATAALDMTVDYLKTRKQFDRPLAMFQALKHRVADHQTALVAARGLVEYAAGLAADHPQALLMAISAKQHAARAVAEIARDCIQLHGGVGFTAEFFPHIYLKRAKVNEAIHGTRPVLLDRIADMLEAA